LSQKEKIIVNDQRGHSKDIDKWLRLIRADEVGAITFARLTEHFRSIDKVLGASVQELTRVEGIGYKTAEVIASTRENFDTEHELELADKLGVTVINIEDARYPVLLTRIYDPPPVLYVKGNLDRRDSLALAIVGSRRCSLYGQEQSSRFAHLLAAAGFTICSGMARGIDTAAHRGALSANGRTIAVQGCGLANIYPTENRKLFEMICENGAVISELPLEYEPLAENFPPRNRIIAGLSLGSIIIEAALRSGAMITARAAMENNREVMAVPGKIDSPLSKGTHKLLKQGATLIESVDDITEALGYIGDQLKDHVATKSTQAENRTQGTLFTPEQLNLSDNERKTYDALDTEPVDIDHIISSVDLPAGAVNATLISLRLKGLIRQFPGSTFARKKLRTRP